MIKFFIDANVHDKAVVVLKRHILNNYEIFSDHEGKKHVGRMLSISGPINRVFSGPFNFEHTPIPENLNTDMSFSDVAIEAASEAWKKAKKENKKIGLFWSGGIDSTVALVSLIMTNLQWVDSLIIYTSHFAVNNEYPLFYEKYLKKADVRFLRDEEFFNPQIWSDDYLVFDGTCGDQIWGCNILAKMNDIAKKPYSSLFSHSTYKQLVDVSKRLITERYIEKLLSLFPVEIKTTQELFWLLTFTHKWDHVRLRHMCSVYDPNVFDKMNSFFNTPNFQRWACSNNDKKMTGDFKTYKQPAKDFIFTFTNDNDYRINKTQFESMGNSITNRSFMMKYKVVSDTKIASVFNLSSYEKDVNDILTENMCI